MQRQNLRLIKSTSYKSLKSSRIFFRSITVCLPYFCPLLWHPFSPCHKKNPELGCGCTNCSFDTKTSAQLICKFHLCYSLAVSSHKTFQSLLHISLFWNPIPDVSLSRALIYDPQWLIPTPPRKQKDFFSNCREKVINLVFWSIRTFGFCLLDT